MECQAGELCPECNGKKIIAYKMTMFYFAQVFCQTCKGTGRVNDPKACMKCNGSKKVIVDAVVGSGAVVRVQVECDECRGTGERVISS